MISKTRRPIEVLALLLCATTASAQENRGAREQRAACAPDALPPLQQLDSRSYQRRALPEAEQVRSHNQPRLPIIFEQGPGPLASRNK